MSDDADNSLKAQHSRKFDTSGEQESETSEFLKTAVLAVLLALFIRTFFFEPFNIPSGSMLPTLQIGDYLFVSKTSYGYSKYSFPFGMADFDGRMMEAPPQRGDVVVFKLPSDQRTDYIKRLVGMPGDTIQVRRGRLYINGEMVDREPVGLTRVGAQEGGKESVMEYIETLPGGVMHKIYEESDSGNLDNTPLYEVPPKHYFMMGDNRDNSADSRVMDLVGFVPEENPIGPARILFFSIDQSAVVYKPWTWFQAIRYGRILKKIEPIRPAEAAAEKKE